jgi:hypothetical protein
MMDGSLPLTIALGGGLIVIIGLILYSISQMMSMVVVGKY